MLIKGLEFKGEFNTVQGGKTFKVAHKHQRRNSAQEDASPGHRDPSSAPEKKSNRG
jgi:hypothetical protein